MLNAANLIHWFAFFVLFAALIAAALSDASHYLIPNRYSAAIAAAFVIYAIGKPFPFWLHGFGAATLLLVAGFALFAGGLFGAGDVKLMTASGFWAGFDQLPLLLLVTAAAGGVLALVQLLVQFSPIGRLLSASPGATVATNLRSRMRLRMPYGVGIAIAGICVGLVRLTSS